MLAGFSIMKRTTVLGLLLAGVACARNNSSDAELGAARDSAAVATDSATANQTESGVTDSSGRSTLGPGAERTRPDQGQPVTSKGDTVNAGVDSSTTAR
jgi:hypothetical protein